MSGSPFSSNMVVSVPTFDPSGNFAYSADFVNKAIVSLASTVVQGTDAFTQFALSWRARRIIGDYQSAMIHAETWLPKTIRFNSIAFFAAKPA
jgi:hypothetical protein